MEAPQGRLGWENPVVEIYENGAIRPHFVPLTLPHGPLEFALIPRMHRKWAINALKSKTRGASQTGCGEFVRSFLECRSLV